MAQTHKKFEERKARVKKLDRVLKKLFPTATCALTFSNPWELTVAVILSAQCTDKTVNTVTPALFKKYPTLLHYVKAKPQEFAKDIYKTGFFNNKTKNILAAAKKVHQEFGGVVPDTMEEILTLPGVAY